MSVSAEVVPKVNKTTNIKVYKKEHYQKNKGYILAFHKQRVKCEKCGKDLAYSSKSSHLKNNRCKILVDLVSGIVPSSHSELVSLNPSGLEVPPSDTDKTSDLDFPNPSLLSTNF
jgi:hypothetical protein